jgi:hypothetical protein
MTLNQLLLARDSAPSNAPNAAPDRNDLTSSRARKVTCTGCRAS